MKAKSYSIIPLNKAVLIFIAVGMIASSCGLFKKGPQPGGKKAKEIPDTAEMRERAKREIIDTIAVKKKVKDSLDKLYPYRFKGTYNIAIILPFYLDFEDRLENQRKKKISSIAQEFYMGAKMALDTLRSCGKNLNVYVFDSENDSMQIRQIRKRLKKGKNLDLIIGPLFTENVKVINEFSANNKVNLLAPLAHVRSCLKNNPYFISMEPGQSVIAEQAAKLINKKFKNKNLFIVRQYDKREREISWKLDTLLDTASLASYTKIALEKGQWNTTKIFKDTLKGQNNVVFIPSQSEVFTTSVLSGIKAVDTVMKDINIEDEVTVIGLPEWLDFSTLDGKMMEKFRMHILADYYVDYTSLKTQDFVRKYRKQNHTEPGKYAFKGYDYTLFLGKMLVKYGVYFQRNWYEQEFKGIHTNFYFKQPKGFRGWQNYYLDKLYFENYQLNEVGWN